MDGACPFFRGRNIGEIRRNGAGGTSGSGVEMVVS